MTANPNFDHYIAVDWSGAKGAAQKGIAVAVAASGRKAPVLVRPPQGRHWRRPDVLAYIRSFPGAQRVLVGMDCSFSLPHEPEQGFFPGLVHMPDQAAGLWALIDGICAEDEDLYAGRFVEHGDFGTYFRRQRHLGARFHPRLRLTESQCAAQGLGRAVSSFHLIGANQVGLGSLAAMRFLHQLLKVEPAAAIWPYGAVGGARLVLVEIYTRLFLTQAGEPFLKIRERSALERALEILGSHLPRENAAFDDHESDALVSAAGLRALVQSGDHAIWQPPALSPFLAKREGWTFGVR